MFQIAVCCADAGEAYRICRITEEQAAVYSVNVASCRFETEEALWRGFEPGRFRCAVVGYGDAKGFLCARRLREEDPGCHVILLDDTDRFAIRGFRIHLTEFLVRPLREQQLRAAIQRVLEDAVCTSGRTE